MKQRVLWTDDEVEILRQSYADKDNHELAKVFGVTPGRIKSKGQSLGLRKSEAGIKAMFARRRFNGQASPSAKPVGSYRIDSGIVHVKVSDEPGPDSNRWRGVHEVLWIAERGPIPEGHRLLFKPGMRTAVLEEITIDKLECVTIADAIRDRCCSLAPEIRGIVQLRGVLTKTIKRSKENG
ncbi:hypothetical protein ACEN88_00525 [Massilia sp. CT11-108]|uniref:hypothetical protein n=1 Tax=Massilia sp. CT11-108 TaxID=3393900 RepID=UPI0039A57665